MNILISTNTEPEWKSITEEELDRKRFELFVMPNWKARLQRHVFIYTDKCKLKIEGFEEPTTEMEGPLPAPVIAHYSSGEERTLTDKELATLINAFDGFMTRYKERLTEGEIIATPGISLRLEDTKICPMCGFGFRGMGSSSRSNNYTEICNDCGMAEAFMDLAQEQKTTVLYYGRPIASIQSALYRDVTGMSNIPLPELIKTWAHRDFGLSLKGEEGKDEEIVHDIRALKEAVNKVEFESISEWVKSNFREYATHFTK
ncbi:hypothetical protein CN918_30050 [Priestia megaterium]|nr:hypothetical protein CN918_30050 [Priestia megaterium]